MVTLIPERLGVNRDNIDLIQLLTLYEVKYQNNFNTPHDVRVCFLQAVADYKGCELDTLVDEFYDFIETTAEEIPSAIQPVLTKKDSNYICGPSYLGART